MFIDVTKERVCLASNLVRGLASMGHVRESAVKSVIHA